MKMSTKFTCRFCKEQFDQPKGLYKHLQIAHSAGSSRDNRTCPICGVLCSKYESYRDHLLHIHGQENEGQKLTFKSLNDFLLWKTELEMKYSCKYNLQSTPKILPTKERKYFYQCDRSDSKQKDKKTLSVVMKTCASVISVFEGSGVLKVEYWDTHTNHNGFPAVAVQNELEAAISSVEMVNAIGESDDSFDKSHEIIAECSPNMEKQLLSSKSHSSSGMNNSSLISSANKTKNMQASGKDVIKKKSANTSILYSLASVACGKGISKKSVNKVNSSKSTESQFSSELPSSSNDALDENLTSKSKQNENSVSVTTTGSTVTTASSLASAAKMPGRATIAPKPPANSLFTGNSAYSNQLVIVNPVGMDQNSTSPVFSAGQNILFSLPLGHSILPGSNSSQSNSQFPPGDKNKVSLDKNKSTDKKFFIDKKSTKSDSPSQIKGKNVLTASPKKSSSKFASNNVPSTTTPITSSNSMTITSNINNAPVILSSLPVGSTFMSVNNNLIPIASPSGAFLPTSLPANIVLTPVTTNSVTSQKDTASKTTSAASQNVPSPLRFTSSSAAITVSSVVKEPMYTSTTVKQLSSTVSPNAHTITTSPISSKAQNMYIPITVANAISPILSKSKAVAGAKATKSFSSKKTATSAHEIIVTPVSSTPSAKKRAAKSLLKQKVLRTNLFESSPLITSKTSTASPVANTQVTNTQLNLAPITSAPNVSVTSQLNPSKLGTLLFESDGEVYMLEPVETDAVQNVAPPKIEPKTQSIKISRAMQTENSNLFDLTPKKKRPVPSDDDSAIMMKVKCYQLEMKYLSCQTECKRLKVELTKEKLKNSDPQGKPVDENMDTEEPSENHGTRAQEIMQEIEDKFSETKNVHIYTLMKTSVLRSLYDDLEELCNENNELYTELENYRAHDKFYKSLKKKLHDEDF